MSFAVLSKQQSIVGQLDRWTGWKQFSLRQPVPFGATSVTLAFGLSVTWETNRSDYLDYAQVTFS